MSDTPIAEQLAAALGLPWPLRRSWLINGHLFEEGPVLSREQDELDQLKAAVIEQALAGQDPRGAMIAHDLQAKKLAEQQEQQAAGDES